MIRQEPFNKTRFVIGDWVEVQATVTTQYGEREKAEDTNTKTLQREELSEPRKGQIVGLSRLYEGKKCGDCNVSYNYHEDYESPYLAIKKIHVVWLIRFGMFNKAVKVLEADLDKCSPLKKLPLLYTKPFEWTERDKNFLRNEMRGWPRDSNGRWQKYIL